MKNRLSHPALERNIAMELVRVTEAAAMAAAHHLGMGSKELVDRSAVEAMRKVLGFIRMDGIVVIGEGEKDRAPMLYVGEQIGDGSPPKVDIAVDPIDGTNLVSKGLPGALSAVALAARGAMNCPRPFVYMNKIITGREACNVIDISASVTTNLKNIAKAKKRSLTELTVIALDRPRNEAIITEIRSTGARVKLISDGDISAGVQAALPETGVDVLMGIGGTPEGVLCAVAVQCIGGGIQCQVWPRDDNEKELARTRGIDVNRIYTAEDMVSGDDIFFAATGVSSGELLKGVHYSGFGAQTQSLAMRSRSGTIRWIDSWHNFERLDKFTLFQLH